jgi:hypothetical protein
MPRECPAWSAIVGYASRSENVMVIASQHRSSTTQRYAGRAYPAPNVGWLGSVASVTATPQEHEVRHLRS